MCTAILLFSSLFCSGLCNFTSISLIKIQKIMHIFIFYVILSAFLSLNVQKITHIFISISNMTFQRKKLTINMVLVPLTKNGSSICLLISGHIKLISPIRIPAWKVNHWWFKWQTWLCISDLQNHMQWGWFYNRPLHWNFNAPWLFKNHQMYPLCKLTLD